MKKEAANLKSVEIMVRLYESVYSKSQSNF